MSTNLICESLDILDSLKNLLQSTGVFQGTNWQNYVMIAISFVLFYLAIKKGFEPLLLLPIAFGMFIVNIPGAYNILFGTKGYIIQEVYTASNGDIVVGAEVFRGTLTEISQFYGTNFANAGEITAYLQTLASTTQGEYTVTLQLASETAEVIRDFGLFYYIYK